MKEDLLDRLSGLLGRERSDIESMMSGLSATIKDYLTEGDSVAIPAFGTFETEKQEEHITTDLATGDRLLMPPCISVKFKPSSLLRRRILKNDLQ